MDTNKQSNTHYSLDTSRASQTSNSIPNNT